MTRSTIDFGIDLGTTNSAIAVLKGNDVQVFKNNQSEEYTPSAVWINENRQLYVGRIAKERIEKDPKNAYAEFKLQMGHPHTYRFEQSGRTMTPEELSAEVLKSLKASVMKRSGEDVQAAVITIPAAFGLAQTEATRKAAVMAGFTAYPLLQEPIAAAQAYGFESKSDKVFWLVYDLGGGTFDAAIMQVREGEIKVVNHGGDNHLGGKLIDWDIVNELFVPELIRRYRLDDFQRGNERWRAAFAQLKAEAEKAKILVSDNDSIGVDIPYLNLGEGRQVPFEYELKRSDVERLAESYILRSINICKKVLADKRLIAGNIDKILLVGGPTLMPYLRDRLADRQNGLGIRVDFSIDPLTVVARGAAIFAGTQRLARDEKVLECQRQEGFYTISFPGWTFKGNDSETMVGGTIKGPGEQSFKNYTVEFINPKSNWRSGLISVGEEGSFLTPLWVKEGEPNRFVVELHDPTGRMLPSVTEPGELTYTVGMVISNVPLTYSVGVALANNEVEWFLDKGRDLPARGRKVLRTAFEVRQGQTGDVIRIPIVEGGNPRADRNQRIGKLEVSSEKVRRDLPISTEVHVTIEIDASRLVRAKAYIPLLDEEFDVDLHLGDREVQADPARLKQELEKEKTRLAELREASASVSVPALEQVDDERMVRDVEVALSAAQSDPDAVDAGGKRLLDLKVALDEAEEALEWPRLVAEAEKVISAGREIIQEQGSAEDMRNLNRAEEEVRAAIRMHDTDLLQQRINTVRAVVARLLDRKGILPMLIFEQLTGMVGEMRNPVQAQQLIREGVLAVQSQNTERLKAINQQLSALLPTPPPPPDISTIGR